MFNSILLIGLGVTEIVLIIAVILLLFGGKKIPELMRGMGKGIKEFKSAQSGEENSTNSTNSSSDERKVS